MALCPWVSDCTADAASMVVVVLVTPYACRMSAACMKCLWGVRQRVPWLRQGVCESVVADRAFVARSPEARVCRYGLPHRRWLAPSGACALVRQSYRTVGPPLALTLSGCREPDVARRTALSQET